MTSRLVALPLLLFRSLSPEQAHHQGWYSWLVQGFVQRGVGGACDERVAAANRFVALARGHQRELSDALQHAMALPLPPASCVAVAEESVSEDADGVMADAVEVVTFDPSGAQQPGPTPPSASARRWQLRRSIVAEWARWLTLPSGARAHTPFARRQIDGTRWRRTHHACRHDEEVDGQDDGALAAALRTSLADGGSVGDGSGGGHASEATQARSKMRAAKVAAAAREAREDARDELLKRSLVLSSLFGRPGSRVDLAAAGDGRPGGLGCAARLKWAVLLSAGAVSAAGAAVAFALLLPVTGAFWLVGSSYPLLEVGVVGRGSAEFCLAYWTVHSLATNHPRCPSRLLAPFPFI